MRRRKRGYMLKGSDRYCYKHCWKIGPSPQLQIQYIYPYLRNGSAMNSWVQCALVCARVVHYYRKGRSITPYYIPQRSVFNPLLHQDTPYLVEWHVLTLPRISWKYVYTHIDTQIVGGYCISMHDFNYLKRLLCNSFT